MALLIDVANAVVAELNSSVLFSDGVTAVMNLKPEFELKDLKELKVTVVPKALKISNETRQDGGREVKVDIGIQRKTADLEIIAELMQLVEDVAGLFEHKRLSQYQQAVCVEIENDPIYDPEHLRQYRQFTSVITLTFRVL